MQKIGLIHNGMPAFFKKLLEVTGAPPASERRPNVCDYCGEELPAGHEGHVCAACRQDAAEAEDPHGRNVDAAELAEIRAYVFSFIPAGGE